MNTTIDTTPDVRNHYITTSTPSLTVRHIIPRDADTRVFLIEETPAGSFTLDLTGHEQKVADKLRTVAGMDRPMTMPPVHFAGNDDLFISREHDNGEPVIMLNLVSEIRSDWPVHARQIVLTVDEALEVAAALEPTD